MTDSAAAARVSGPAIFLILVGILDILVAFLMIGYTFTDFYAEAMAPLTSMPNSPYTPESMKIIQVVQSLLGVAIGGFVIFGGLQMKGLKSHGLAMAGAIAAMLPCAGCCWLGIPAGIWALVVLSKPEVKAGFGA